MKVCIQEPCGNLHFYCSHSICLHDAVSTSVHNPTHQHTWSCSAEARFDGNPFKPGRFRPAPSLGTKNCPCGKCMKSQTAITGWGGNRPCTNNIPAPPGARDGFCAADWPGRLSMLECFNTVNVTTTNLTLLDIKSTLGIVRRWWRTFS